jgi:C1A family cysteine protease
MKALANFGCSREDLWPYDVRAFSREPDQRSKDDGTTRQVVAYFRCTDLAALKTSIADGFPVEFGFKVPEGMFSDECQRTGVVPMPVGPDDSVGGHAVMAVGYDDARGLVKFQNSWSASWGDVGFGYLPYEYFTTGLAHDMWTVRELEPAAPEPEPVPPTPAPKKRCWLLRLLDWVLRR